MRPPCPGTLWTSSPSSPTRAYWSDALEGAFTVGETPFEDRDELLEELCMSVLRSNPLEYREDEGYSADNMVYLVSAGGRDVCRVTVDELTENGNAGFGFTYLAVTRVELLASFTAPEQYEIDITAPADAAVYVNGVLVTPITPSPRGDNGRGPRRARGGPRGRALHRLSHRRALRPRRGLRRRGRRQRARRRGRGRGQRRRLLARRGHARLPHPRPRGRVRQRQRRSSSTRATTPATP